MTSASALLEGAVEAAAGAEYVAARFMSTRAGHLALHDGAVESTGESTDRGIAVRVLVDGCWGFAASDTCTLPEAVRLAQSAVRLARLSSPLVSTRVELAGEPVHQGRWTSPYDIDPFAVPAAERVALLAERSQALLGAEGIAHVDARLAMVQEDVHYLDNRGSIFSQHRSRIEAEWSATAIHPGTGAFDTMSTT
ncbi:MAG: DNA gyrase modulator, partial [Candidatus Nanopelagicales bacterium]